MMRQYELVERVKEYDPDADEALLNRAYVYAMKAHGAQKRASGDPYFTHPLEVAGILTDLKLDDATIATALLHDTIEDTVATRERDRPAVRRGRSRALVDGVTKLTKIEAQSENERAGREPAQAPAGDVRRHPRAAGQARRPAAQHAHAAPHQDRRRSAGASPRETMEIYAPLAGRIGMHECMRESSRTWPSASSIRTPTPSISERLAQLRERGRRPGRRGSSRADGSAGRRRPRGARSRAARSTPYSIWRKMAAQDTSASSSSPTSWRSASSSTTPRDCYQALGVIHSRWPMVPGRFKDYISTPKRNGYRSLHTTVIGPSRAAGRNADPHRARCTSMAEYGLAAHWAYKQGEPSPTAASRAGCAT